MARSAAGFLSSLVPGWRLSVAAEGIAEYWAWSQTSAECIRGRFYYSNGVAIVHELVRICRAIIAGAKARDMARVGSLLQELGKAVVLHSDALHSAEGEAKPGAVRRLMASATPEFDKDFAAAEEEVEAFRAEADGPRAAGVFFDKLMSESLAAFVGELLRVLRERYAGHKGPPTTAPAVEEAGG